MAKIQGVTSIAASPASNNNVLAGSAFEFVKVPSLVRFYAVGDAAGELRVTIQSGSDVLLEESPVSRAARVPIVPDDLTVEDVAEPGDRLKLAVRNTGAGANNLFWAVEVVPAR